MSTRKLLSDGTVVHPKRNLNSFHTVDYSFKRRRSTFDSFEQFFLVNVDELARNGFVYIVPKDDDAQNDLDMIECEECKLKLSQFIPEDNIVQLHRKYCPSFCRFVHGNTSTDIPPVVKENKSDRIRTNVIRKDQTLQLIFGSVPMFGRRLIDIRFNSK
ncbi:hypothetical protein SNEBB_001900 [Seison nebaliae]|nr:hypothetical protein SNEBB_001900 [Seison nebaliae]